MTDPSMKSSLSAKHRPIVFGLGKFSDDNREVLLLFLKLRNWNMSLIAAFVKLWFNIERQS